MIYIHTFILNIIKLETFRWENSMDEKHYEFLKQKSIDSFLLSLEIFNKPTIDYRLEGCVFFLCNAWELMLKAKLLKDNKSIYYPKSSRTLSLSDCASKVMTNKNDPVRINLDLIISLRNTATHDIIPEFEIAYLPYLTFCVKSYSDKMYKYLDVNVSDYIKSDFLSLFTNNNHIEETQILSKYGNDMKNIFDKKMQDIYDAQGLNPNTEIGYIVNVNLKRVSNKDIADYTFYASNNPKDINVKYIDRFVDLNQNYPLGHHRVANEIDKKIKQGNIRFNPLKDPVKTERKPNPNIFTTACLDVIIKKYNIKENEEYCQKIENGNQLIYKYSWALVDFVIMNIMGDPDLVRKNK